MAPNKATAYKILLCSNAANKIASFEKKPEKGGIPAMAIQPIKNVM